jgi:type II secretory pathway pseudopilin PulG
MIVIAIIGILMTLATTAVMRAVGRGKETAARLEINALQQAVEKYNSKYGDYPPDGSSYAVLIRHMGRIFPRMSPQDKSLLDQLVQDRSSGAFSYVAMDRAEALVFFLGGFSENVLFPLTGEGGPLKLSSNPVNANASDLANYEYNGTRDNAFFDFDPSRLTTARDGNGYLMSTDEALLGVADPLHGGNDPLPVYLARTGVPTPLVYFDSRTYGSLGPGVFNGYNAGRYGTSEYGGIRPYLTGLNANGNTFADLKFHNDSTFQIISPGLDGVFGSVITTDPSDTTASPVYFVTETGVAVGPNGAPSIRAFQDVDWLSSVTVNGHLDNLTNFSSSTLESDLP